MDEPLHERSPGELSDAELRVGMFVYGQRRDELAALGRHEDAEVLQVFCLVLAAERDRRHGLYAAVDDVFSPFAVSPASIIEG